MKQSASVIPTSVNSGTLPRKMGVKKIKTLFTYLNNDRSLQNTAGELYIHRNTLVYRIHRITESLTCNIDDIYSRDYIKMSIRVLRLYYLNGINSPFLP